MQNVPCIHGRLFRYWSVFRGYELLIASLNVAILLSPLAQLNQRTSQW